VENPNVQEEIMNINRGRSRLGAALLAVLLCVSATAYAHRAGPTQKCAVSMYGEMAKMEACVTAVHMKYLFEKEKAGLEPGVGYDECSVDEENFAVCVADAVMGLQKRQAKYRPACGLDGFSLDQFAQLATKVALQQVDRVVKAILFPVDADGKERGSCFF
jgi:hypothetical protein